MKIARRTHGLDPMPEKHREFMLEQTFTPAQMAALRRGHIPGPMEDKWYSFMEGDTLYIHRSWTGRSVYRIDFNGLAGPHRVAVNLDPGDSGDEELKEAREWLAPLLDRWSDPDCDGEGE